MVSTPLEAWTKIARGRGLAALDVRPQDFHDIACWLAPGREITHGLRHAFARLDVNDIIRLEQECSIWRSRMLQPPVMALAPSPAAWADVGPGALADVTTPA